MTTLAVNTPRVFEGAPVRIEESALPVIAADIIFEGAAVGIVDASGHGRPLVGGDIFAGFANAKVDNSAGLAAAKNVDLKTKGYVELAVSGAVITDRGQPVYATDDNAFTFNPVGGTFIGFMHRFVSAGVAIVSFDVDVLVDPYGEYSVRETLAGTKTFDAEDSGKLFAVTEAGDGDALTLPAVADGFAGALIVAVGAFGTTALTISPAADDLIRGPDITAANDKNLILTKATQRRGDSVYIHGGDADGYVVGPVKGTWAREA